MEKREDIQLLFDIGKLVKQFYETPVIYFTNNDFSRKIFDIMCVLRVALINTSKNDIINSVVDLHLQWIHDVNELDNFQRRMHKIEREEVYEAVSYTIDAMASRLKSYNNFVQSNKTGLSAKLQLNLNADLEIIEEMNKEVIQKLLEQLKCFRNFAADEEFKIQIKESLNELYSWLDKMYDCAANKLSQYLSVHVPHLISDLTQTLQKIVTEIQAAQTSAEDEVKGPSEGAKVGGISEMIHCRATHDLEISTVQEKVNVLDERLRRLSTEPTSAAVMALQNKKKYLLSRLASLEKLKTTIIDLHRKAGMNIEKDEACECEDFYAFKIFNHSLSTEVRERLVTELCYLWDLAVFGTSSRKSVISILSFTDNKDEFSDELGTFYIDEYGRKIYKLPEDETLYQPNENNELVPLSDDTDHVYYYDECGRYFMDTVSRKRVYKAHATASEYMMDVTGCLLKTQEERDGIIYRYDHFGRYYIDDKGNRIYRDVDSTSEYETDGLGNLVRIRNYFDLFQSCPGDVNVTEDFKYLQSNVGAALRTCIAACIVTQPADPIAFLSNQLVKYRENMELRENLLREKEELSVQREIWAAEERAAAERAALEAAMLHDKESEATSYDTNLMNYDTQLDNKSFTSSK